MSKLPIFLSVGNLKPKLKSFFKLKLKPIFFLLICHPGEKRERRAHGEDMELRDKDGRR